MKNLSTSVFPTDSRLASIRRVSGEFFTSTRYFWNSLGIAVFAGFPLEIILYLGEHLDNTTLARFIRTSRCFARVLTRELYDRQFRTRDPQPSSNIVRNWDRPSRDEQVRVPLKQWDSLCDMVRRWESEYILSYFTTHFRRRSNDDYIALDPNEWLLNAVRGKNKKMVKIMLQHGADVNSIAVC